MPTVRLGAAALNQTPLDWTGNSRRIVAAIGAARDAGVGLLCLPELCVSGYGCEDAFFAGHVRERALDSLLGLLPESRGMAVTVGLPVEIDGVLRNAAAMIADGRLLGFALKQNLADDGIHYEPRWFRPWPAGEVVEIELGGERVPAGDLVFDFSGIGVGFEICRDAWVEDRPARRLRSRGVSLVLNPSASHFAFGKQVQREAFVREGSRLVDGVYLYVNLLGNESGRAVYDGGVLLADRDELLASGRRFSYRDHSLVHMDVEVPAREPDRDTPRVACDFDPARLARAAPTGPDRGCEVPDLEEPSAPQDPERLACEDFSRAVPLGIFDYLRKSRAAGLVLSLSGGADSAATAVCVWLMARFGREELGSDGFARRLPRVEGLVDSTDAGAMVRRLLTTVYQATRNSSDTTRLAAEEVAGAIGAEHHEWSVDELVEQYVRLAERSIGRPLAWETDDLALQNIQSRVRSPGVWLLANLKQSLLLTTGNRSEAAVGYATMDGDTSGGLAPLAGVDKAFLLRWLRWMETEGPEAVGPLPVLAAINAQQPTAELRPLGEGQTDESDLMPYEVLAVIERSAIGALDTPQETLGVLCERFPNDPPEQLEAWVERFHHLWRVSQWKRERLAPALHLDTLSVDPKTWRRWPILSGEG